MLHGFIDRVIDLSVGDVLRLASKLVESAPQNVQHSPGVTHLRSRMGFESHNADFFVIT
jgi:hypothetical protein